MGVAWSLTGKPEADFAAINACLPTEWKAADNTPVEEESAPSESRSAWSTIIEGGMKVVDYVCTYKEQMLSFIMRRLRRLARRNKYRMFYEGKITRRNHGWFGDAWGSVKNAAGVVFNKVKSWANTAWDTAKSVASGVFSGIKPMYDQVKSKVTAFFSEDFQGKVAAIQQCVQDNRKLPGGLKDAMLSIKTRVQNVYNIVKQGQWKELARLFVNIVCDPSFKQAFTFLADGLSQSNLPKKYALFGKFLGKLLIGAPTRRYRH